MPSTTLEKYRVAAENAGKISLWLKERGGIQIWKSRDLADPGASKTTPYLDPAGNVAKSPGWKFGDKPDRHITDEADVEVAFPKLVESFRVKFVQKGMRITVNAAGSRKIKLRLGHWSETTGKEAFYTFDSSDVVNVYVDDVVIPLQQWAQRAA
jgi:hypothetical protein